MSPTQIEPPLPVITVETILTGNPGRFEVTVTESEFQKNLKNNPEQLIRFYAREKGLNEDLVVCIARRESTLNPKAISPSGKYQGLFQFDQPTFGEGDRLDPVENTKRATERMSKGEWRRWPNTYKACKSPETTNSNGNLPTSGDDYGTNYVIVSQYERRWTNCVNLVRSIRPDYPQSGSPRTTPVFFNSQTPSVNAVAVQRNHVSIVLSWTDTTVRVREANFKSGFLTDRTIPRNKILGYYI
ncbi:MAG: lytic transglycosylase domain-containing protein [Candidatus Berkelbacteria bacterium]|nr:lytic transglycosylase domain-containing protein [Candidatus Berkelbacteria bacterium]